MKTFSTDAVLRLLCAATLAWTATVGGIVAVADEPSRGDIVTFLGDDATGRDPADVGALAPDQFVNPIAEGADPWVTRDPIAGRYLWCFSDGNRAIAIHTSDRLTSLGRKHIVWQAPAEGPFSKEIWAPELHLLDGHWHIYFAASDGRNENHLAYVLRSKTDDPLGAYELHGPLATGAGADGRTPNIWAIDMTVLEHNGQRYALWSGWDAPGTDQQYLYIAPMKSPVELAGPRVRICDNDDYPWERTEPGAQGRGLNEAPQVLKQRSRTQQGRTFVTYSCGASWLPSYKLGLLELVGEDPLDPRSWHKQPRPWFEGNAETFGVGHSCFVTSPDGSQWWHVYHAKRDRAPGWRRLVFVQPMSFDAEGLPQLGSPVAPGSVLQRPAGEPIRRLAVPFKASLNSESELEGWNYFGHHQFIDVSANGLHLGRLPAGPINDYRSGEKLVLDAVLPADFTVEVTIDFLGNPRARDAGLLFRTTASSVGYDAQHGYFAGLIPQAGLVIVGRTDGSNWTELARVTADFDPAAPQQLGVTAVDDEITVTLAGDPVLLLRDATYSSGTIGLRVVDTHAQFSDLEFSPASVPAAAAATAEP